MKEESGVKNLENEAMSFMDIPDIKDISIPFFKTISNRKYYSFFSAGLKIVILLQIWLRSYQNVNKKFQIISRMVAEPAAGSALKAASAVWTFVEARVSK